MSFRFMRKCTFKGFQTGSDILASPALVVVHLTHRSVCSKCFLGHMCLLAWYLIQRTAHPDIELPLGLACAS